MLRTGNCRGAIVEFRTSLEAYDSPNTRLLYARCLGTNGDVVAAVTEYDRTERDAAAHAAAEPRFAPTRDSAISERAPFEARVGRVVVHPDAARTPSRIVVAGREVSVDTIAGGVPVLPGAASIQITYGDGSTSTLEATATAGTRVEVADHTTPVVVVAAASSPPPPPVRAVPRGSPLPVWLPYSLAGVGAAGLIVSLGLYVGALGEYQSNLASCGSNCTDEQIARGRAFETVSYVSLGVGAAFVAAGVVTWIVNRRAEPRVSVSVGPASVGVLMRF